MMPTIDTDQGPHAEAETAIWIKTESYMATGVEFTGQLQACTQAGQRSETGKNPFVELFFHFFYTS